jgi:CBS domain-containing protein
MAQLVRDLMAPHPIVLQATSSLVEAALAMRDFEVDILLVLDGEQVCGIVTDRDLVVRGIANGYYPATMTLGEICAGELPVLSPTDHAEEVIALMRQQAIPYLPVMEHGRPVGIMVLRDLSLEANPPAPLGDAGAIQSKR